MKTLPSQDKALSATGLIYITAQCGDITHKRTRAKRKPGLRPIFYLKDSEQSEQNKTILEYFGLPLQLSDLRTMANEAAETFGILVEALSNLQDVCNGAIGISDLPKVSTSAFQHFTEASLSIAMYWHWPQNPGSSFFRREGFHKILQR